MVSVVIPRELMGERAYLVRISRLRRTWMLLVLRLRAGRPAAVGLLSMRWRSQVSGLRRPRSHAGRRRRRSVETSCAGSPHIVSLAASLGLQGEG